jgi:feruloyl esterase
LAHASLAPTPIDAAATCESLAKTTIRGGTITASEEIAAGAFTFSAGRGAPSSVQHQQQDEVLKKLPAFCRVQATLTPSADSDIKVELWLPVTGWNGKFQAVGNGGWTGSIAYSAMVEALRRGYATSSTDTGHVGGSASFALGHPERLIDFGYRSVHEMALTGKTVVAAYYGNAPRLSYWSGCSAGGRQGLKEAQRFPADYDGIVAGAPANYWTHLVTGSIWVAQATLKDPASFITPPQYALINKAVIDACDALDGVKDGLLENPAQCRFDPKVLQCAGQEGPACLTAAQVAAVGRIYGPAKNPRTGAVIFPGLAPGSELGWGALAGGPKPLTIADDHFKYVVFADPEWDFRTFDFDRDLARADQLDGGALNATDPDLRAFAARGGKLLMYHGWNDQLIAPQNSIDYYGNVTRTVGADSARNLVRLFMAPGMQHCGGGIGPDSFDMLSALEEWVEKRTPPAQVVASHSTAGKIDRTRPLCPYPQVAQYRGTGSIDDAAAGMVVGRDHHDRPAVALHLTKRWEREFHGASRTMLSISRVVPTCPATASRASPRCHSGTSSNVEG